MDKRHFVVAELGTSYSLPKWRVVEGKGIVQVSEVYSEEDQFNEVDVYTQIRFVRGSKAPGGESIEKVDGILHETLLSMMIHDLKYKNQLVPSRESALAITKLEEALFWMEERQRNRAANGTQGTYQK